MTTPKSPIRVGVLSLHNSKETKAILNAIDDLGHDPVWLREENITFQTNGTNVTPDPDIDIVVNRLLLTKGVRPIEDLTLAVIYNEVRPMLNTPRAVLPAMHKFAVLWQLMSAGVPVPDSFFALDYAGLNEGRSRFTDQIIQKIAISTNGVGVWDVDDDPLAPTVANRRTFLQEFIDSSADGHYDLRVYVVDGDIIGAMKRYASENDWRANVAQGGEVKGITKTLPSKAGQLAIHAIAVLGLDYAGVDLMEQDGEWYVIEVNVTAGFKGLFDATNVSVAPHIARLAIERGGGRVDEAHVSELETTLDDSVPKCKPASAEHSPEQTTIGYTEEVILGGTTSFTTTVAKSDTGAHRTSISLELASEIGAGPIISQTAVKSGSSKSSSLRPLVEIAVGIRGTWQVVTVSVEDREHMEYQMIVGRDILANHQIDLQRRVDEE